MSFSSFYPSPPPPAGGGADSGNGDDSGAGSEECVEVGREPGKSVMYRGSGSKRSRAAEVHNLSEKRRRSRINEKMKALQNLIPNSNKTDKASMLDEAIEYLKQLQLQVQMLSMRNGLSVHPVYLPRALTPLQASQLCAGLGVDNTSAMNMGLLGMPHVNQDSSFDLSSQCTSSCPPTVLPTAVGCISAPETSYGMESSQSQDGSFKLPVISEGMFIEDMVPRHQLDSGQTTRNLTGNEMNSMAKASSLHFNVQESSSLQHNDDLQDLLSKDHPDNNQIFIQHLDE